MKLSIIIPVYNNGDYLDKTLKSIIDQSFKDFEVIIVNDGSTDNSQSIIDSFTKTDKRIKSIVQSNQGVSKARNRGMQEANGEFVFFVDGDDRLIKDSLKKMNQISIINECDLIIGVYERMDGVTIYENTIAKRLCERTTRVDKRDTDILRSWSLCNKWFRKSIIDTNRIEFEDYTHFEDAVFLYSFLKTTNKIYTCPYTIYTYRKPLAFIGRTTTQKVDNHLLDSSYNAYLRISELVEVYGTDFIAELKRKYISSLVVDYYRHFWSLDNKLRTDIYDRINLLYDELTAEQKLIVSKTNRDIFCGDKLASPETIIKCPLVTVYVDGVKAEIINDFLCELYDQRLIAFQVKIKGEYEPFVEKKYIVKDNLSFYNIDTISMIEACETPYACYVDCSIIYDYRSLLAMFKQFTGDAILDYVILKPHRIIGEKAELSRIQRSIYERYDPSLDGIYANKMFRTSSIKKHIHNSVEGDQKSTYKIINKPVIIDYRTEHEETKNIPTNLLNRIKHDNREDRGVSIRKYINKVVRNLFSQTKETKKKAPSTKTIKCECYYNLEVEDNTILLEPLGKLPKGNMLYLMRALTKDKYSRFKIYITVNNDTREETERILALENFNNVKPLLAGSKDYIQCIFSAKYLFNEVKFPSWWIKKPGQIYTNIWHGTPLKKLYDIESSIFRCDASAVRNFLLSDYILFPSEYTRQHLITDSGVEPLIDGKGIWSGYPRTGILLDDKVRSKQRASIGVGEDKQVIVWMPTWREGFGEEEVKSFIYQMEDHLDENQILYVKLHHKSGNQEIINNNLLHIKLFPEDIDTYELLAAADVLITDYSSVFYDFAVTERRIILYCPDYEEFINTRGVYDDINKLPFPVVRRFPDLIVEINKTVKCDYVAFKEKFNNYDSINNAVILCDAVIDQNNISSLTTEINPVNKKITIIYSDCFADRDITSKICHMAHNGWPEDTYLSYNDQRTLKIRSEGIKFIKDVPVLPTTGSPIDERSERKRLFGSMVINKIVLIDVTNPETIRTFSRFYEPVLLCITKELYEQVRSNNKKIINAIDLFNRYGTEIISFSEEISKYMQDHYSINVKLIESMEEVLK